MDPRPCVVVDGDDRWSGTVLHWYRTDQGWTAVVRFTKWTPDGWPMQYEHPLPADCLEPA